jgi:hypothetical protein
MRLMARLIALLLALGGMTFLGLGAASPAQAKDMNCDDFNTQSAAQQYFNNNGGSPSNNVDGLDSDGDGVVCETNPCPCTTGGGGGGGGGDSTPAKKLHVINLTVAKVSGNLKVVGKVPTYRGKFQLLRSVNGGKFTFYTRTQAANPDGKVTIQVKGPRGSCFQASVPATEKYKLTTKKVGCIR